MSRIARGLLAVALAAALSACGDDNQTVARAKAREVGTLDAAVPLEVDGLKVEKEDIEETLETAQRPYLSAAALYSFREEELLQATLQIGRFSDDVDPDDEEFIDGLVSRVGSSARQFRIGQKTIWMTGANAQTLSVWFDDRHMYVLSTREGFEGGRALLRKAVEIQP